MAIKSIASKGNKTDSDSLSRQEEISHCLTEVRLRELALLQRSAPTAHLLLLRSAPHSG